MSFDFLWPPSTEVGATLYVGYLTAVLAFVAAVIALWGVSTHRVIERRKQTLQFIMRQEADKDLIEARYGFIKYAQEKGGLAKYAEKSKASTIEARHIRTALNEYELLAIGMQKGVIDFDTFCRWHKSGTLTDWRHAAPFVFALRTRAENDALYHEFEELVRWLKDNKLPKRYRWRGEWF